MIVMNLHGIATLVRGGLLDAATLLLACAGIATPVTTDLGASLGRRIARRLRRAS